MSRSRFVRGIGLLAGVALLQLLVESATAEVGPASVPAALALESTAAPPWPRRHRTGVQIAPSEPGQGPLRADPQDRGGPLHLQELRELGLRPRGEDLLDLRSWPGEPPTPRSLDAGRFARALAELCPPWQAPDRDRMQAMARWIVKYGDEQGVDPAMIAALVYQQSRCRPRKQSSWGLGLAMINRGMHLASIQDGEYRYWVLEGGVWKPRRLRLGRFRFTRSALLHAEPNLYFAAALLRVFTEQCPSLDRAFRSVPHRHPVSHFIWGDSVHGAGVEDRVLRARRRLLEYYQAAPLAALGRFQGLPLHCPLDGAPRKVTSGVGDDREGGRRRHTGIDLSSDWGEPVRAIAPGKVLFAGVDFGGGRLRPLDPKLTRLVAPGRIGPRGLLVTIEHEGGLTSFSMHLSTYVVRTGERVNRAQLIGYVGRTGIKESEAHLHLGLQHLGQWIDPLPYLRAYLIPPEATFRGRHFLWQQRQRRQTRGGARR